jgi:hypothetical protein
MIRQDGLAQMQIRVSYLSLLNRAADACEHGARMGTDQSNHPHRYRQNDSEHYGVLRDILAFFLLPRFAKKVGHWAPVWSLFSQPHSQTAPFAVRTQRPIRVAYW